MPMLSVLVAAITAGFVALVLLWPRVRSGPAGARLVAEVSITTLAIVALIFGLLVAAERLL